MATNFPTSLDTLTNPNPTSDTVTVPHSSQHANANDSIEALEAKVGVNGSAVTTSHDYKLSLVTATDKSLPRDAAAVTTNKTLGSGTKILVGSDATGDTYYNGGSGTVTRRAIGSEGQVLTVAAGVPVWSSPSTLNTNYAGDTGVANAYIVGLSPALGAYVAGTRVEFKATNANTTTSTINVNGLGVKTIKKLGGTTDLASGDIATGMVVELEYDGTNFVMLNPVANAPLSASSITSSIYGNGADGNVTINSNTTLTSDMNYNNLTINPTFTLTTAGYRVFVAGTLTNNGTIDNSGANAVTNTGGAGGLAGTMLGGSAGAASTAQGGGGGGGGGIVVVFAKNVAVQGTIRAIGGNGAAAQTPSAGNVNGTAGTATSRTLIQSGSAGAGGACTSQSGGTGGVITTSSKMTRGTPTLLMSMVDGILQLTGGAGAGSGGSNVTSGTSGGGGGGQGGVVVFVYNSLTTAGTVSVAGGSSGAGFGAGSAGVAGGSGLAISIQCNA